MLTIERLRYALKYDQETGLFTAAISRRPRIYPGDSVGSISPTTGYLNIRLDRRSYLAHRLAWFYVHGVWPMNFIDHIDRDRQNNRIENLRDVTRAENRHNTGLQKNNTSGYAGVGRHGNKWRADLRIFGKRLHLGLFKTPEQASGAYVEAQKIFQPNAHVGAKPSAETLERIARIKKGLPS